MQKVTLQPGDYVATADIKDEAEYHAIVEQVIKAGFSDYGVVGFKRLGIYGFLMIDREGDFIGQAEHGAKECSLGKRQLTPAQILGEPQWVPEVGERVLSQKEEDSEWIEGEVKCHVVDAQEGKMAIVDLGDDWVAVNGEHVKQLPTKEDRAVEEMIDVISRGRGAKHSVMADLAARRMFDAGYRKQPQSEEDMSDPASWRAGDLIGYHGDDDAYDWWDCSKEYLACIHDNQLGVLADDGEFYPISPADELPPGCGFHFIRRP